MKKLNFTVETHKLEGMFHGVSLAYPDADKLLHYTIYIKRKPLTIVNLWIVAREFNSWLAAGNHPGCFVKLHGPFHSLKSVAKQLDIEL